MINLIFIIFNVLILVATYKSCYIVPIRWLEGFYGMIIVPLIATIATTMIIQTILFPV